MTEKVKKGDKVKVEYTGKLTDGSVFDSSEGRAPLCFEVGSKQVIPGFDQAVEGMNKGEEKTVKIASKDAYGDAREELKQEIPRDKLPEKPEPEVGMTLVMKAPTGQQIPARITKVADGKVTIDINHPLAGKDLEFQIKVVGINEPEDKKEETTAAEKDGDKDSDEESCGDCSSCCGCGH